MKLLCSCFVLSMLLIGCVPTTGGYWQKTLVSQEPYVFIYSGSQPDAVIQLKRVLLSRGFTIADYDTSVGVLSTGYKQLTEKERIDAAAILAVNTSNQNGRSVFFFDHKADTLQISMRCFANVNGEYAANAFKNNKISEGDTQLQQGHPFPMSLREAILSVKGFSLIAEQDAERKAWLGNQ